MSLRTWICALVLMGGFVLAPVSADACPMCKEANESQDETTNPSAANNRPKAYMYSILFMIGMPTTIFAGIGIGMYKMGKREAAMASELGVDQPTVE